MNAPANTRLIEGADASERAAAVAGALAEAGVVELAYLAPGAGWRPLRTRETNLPGLLAEAAAAGLTVELLALDRPLRVVVAPDAARWIEGDPGPQSRPE